MWLLIYLLASRCLGRVHDWEVFCTSVVGGCKGVGKVGEGREVREGQGDGWGEGSEIGVGEMGSEKGVDGEVEWVVGS